METAATLVAAAAQALAARGRCAACAEAAGPAASAAAACAAAACAAEAPPGEAARGAAAEPGAGDARDARDAGADARPARDGRGRAEEKEQPRAGPARAGSAATASGEAAFNVRPRPRARPLCEHKRGALVDLDRNLEALEGREIGLEIDTLLVQEGTARKEVLLERWTLRAAPIGILVANDEAGFAESGAGAAAAAASLAGSILTQDSQQSSPSVGQARKSSAAAHIERRSAVMLRSVISLAASLPTSRFTRQPNVVQRLRVVRGYPDEAHWSTLKPSLERAEFALPLLWCGPLGVLVSVNYLSDLSTAGLSAPLIMLTGDEALTGASRTARHLEGHLSKPLAIPSAKKSWSPDAHRETFPSTPPPRGKGNGHGNRGARREDLVSDSGRSQSSAYAPVSSVSPSSSPSLLASALRPRSAKSKSLPSGHLGQLARPSSSPSSQTRRVQIVPFRRTATAGSSSGVVGAATSREAGSTAREGLVFYAYSGRTAAEDNASAAPHSLPTRLTHVYFPSGRRYPSLSGPEMESMSASLQSSQQLLRSLSSLDRSMREISDPGAARRESDLGELSSSASPPSRSLPEPHGALSVGPFKSRDTRTVVALPGAETQASASQRSALRSQAGGVRGRLASALEEPAAPFVEMPWHMEEDEIDALAANFLSAFGDVLAQSTNYDETPASPMDLPFDMADGSLDSATKCPTLDGEDDHGHDFRALCQLSSSGLGFKAGPGGLPEAGSLEDAEQEFLRLTR